MGILDPDGFAAGEMLLDPDLSRRAFEALPDAASLRGPRRLLVPDRGGEHRRGRDQCRRPPRRRPARLQPRRLRRGRPDAAARGSRPAAGAAGRRPAAPRPVLGARPAQHRPRLLQQPQLLRVLAPEAAPAIAAVFEQMEAQLRAHDRRTTTSRDRAPELRRAPDRARAGRRRSSSCPTGRSTRRRSPTMVALFHEQYERRYGNRFDVRARAGRHLSRAADRAVRQGRVRRRRRRGASSRRAGAQLELRYFDDDLLEAASTGATSLPVGARVDGPGDHPRGPLDDVRLPAADGEIGSFGEIVIEQAVTGREF